MTYPNLYRNLMHLFWNLDTINRILFIKFGKDTKTKTKKHHMKLIKFEKWTNETANKLKTFLENKIFKNEKAYFCVNCIEGFKNFNSAHSELLQQIPKIISDLKKENTNIERSFFLKRLRIFMKKVGQQVRVFLSLT